jgi:hypothetical protein
MATFNYEYNAELTLDTNTGLYNLFITTYNGNDVNLDIFICERRHEMRLDLVANDIYKTTRYVGTLCQLNNIMNPFSIREGDVLFYTSADQSEGLLQVPEIIRQSGIEELLSNVKSDLIKALKKKKPDPNKRNYNKRGDDVLPPTVLPTNVPASAVENDKILVAPDLFRSPKQDPVSIEPTTTQTPVQGVQPTEDTTERVLINRYIKLINN